jgi:hypothetical protein
MNEFTGSVLWRFNTGFVVRSSPAIVDGVGYFGSQDRCVYAFNANTGAQIWNYGTGGEIYSSPAVAYGKVFIGSSDGVFRALNKDTGSLVWTYNDPEPSGNGSGYAPVVADGVVYIEGANKIVALNATNGSLIWIYGIPVSTYTSPSIADGKVYMGSSNGNVYCIGSGGVRTLSGVGPSDSWIGLKNSDDVGTNFDLKAELYLGGVLVGSGELLNATGGSSGFNNARLREILLTLINPEPLQKQTLEYKLYVRVSQDSRHRSGTARLWFNDGQANSSVDIVIDGSTTRYYLRSGFTLSAGPGSTRQYLDVLVDRAKNGNAYKPFGTWSIIP